MPAIILILSLNLTSICVTGSIGIEVINSQNNLYYDKFFIKDNYNKDNYNKDNYNKDTCSIYNKHLASSPILIPYKK